MAWTAPRTWVTGETVTAALLNTHVRDNLLVAAPAVLTTTGDVLYASGANAPARLAASTDAKVLVGGASAPAWSDEISARFIVNESLVVKESAAADPQDSWRMTKSLDEYRIIHSDDSGPTDTIAIRMDAGDFILHSGSQAVGVGAVVIGTHTNDTTAAILTTGGNFLSVTHGTGGPAYVLGSWMVRIKRTSAASVSSVDIQAREDGNSLGGPFDITDPNGVSQGDIIPAVDDEHVFSGSFWRRVTVSDSSAYQVFIAVGDNSRFEFLRGNLFVHSIQYPT